jgi:hypothetical protein
MKKLALALFAMTSFSVMAQSLESDISRKIERLGRLAERGEVSRLSVSEKMELNQQLQSALRTLRDNDDYRPNPGPINPRPTPTPGFPGRGRRFETQATVLVKDHMGKVVVLTIGGRNPGDILGQCVTQLPQARLSSIISKLVITSNNNSYEVVSLFSSNLNDVCTNIVNRMKPERPDWQVIDVSGTMTDHMGKSTILNIFGDRGEVLEQCVDQVTKSNSSSIISRLNISVNRGSLLDKRLFANTGDVCVELASILNKEAP